MNIKNIKWIEEVYPPATSDEIEMVEKTLSLTIPNVYKALLKASNGISSNLVQLYDTVSLIEMNQIYEVQEYAPGYISIGNDCCGNRLLMIAQKDATQFQLVDDVVGVPSDEDCFNEFTSWLFSEEGDPQQNAK